MNEIVDPPSSSGVIAAPGERYMRPAAPNDSAVLMGIIERAATMQDFSVDRLTQLLELKERWDTRLAKRAFTEAMAKFKENPPQIFKNKHVSHAINQGKGLKEYDHATHSEVTMKVIAGLASVGISHRWIPTQPNGAVQIECVLTHAMGHSESTIMLAAPDDTGNKSPVQAIASTSTLLQRYTLLAATGLSAADLPDADDDPTKPELPGEVTTGLEAAAQLGAEALTAAWQALTKEQRAIITLHYPKNWEDLKTEAMRRTTPKREEPT